ncbi:hypothetical protein KIW84_036050 [Lathyrus oleraceus]|uniref:Saccharopine dehydrogenase NADP binding domain-containing protein n=1 Tax=Pisum sativum TaxID=3888 RepID=A0A9D5B6I5_PEA|nr:hypothetical protein KIW84_036050 [Pisum sativum]
MANPHHLANEFPSFDLGIEDNKVSETIQTPTNESAENITPKNESENALTPTNENTIVEYLDMDEFDLNKLPALNFGVKKEEASNPNPPPTITILPADTSDPSSLRSLCSQTRLILNCVGPFRLHGETVVSACVDSGCDYLNICGEPEFMERMESDYHDRAGETGSLVVSACGFDSVPAELGLLFNSLQWVGPAVPNRVEAYVSLESRKRIVGNFATYESAVLGVANAKDLQGFRRSRPRRRPRRQVLFG